jgi:hypothetical protein
MEFRKIWPEPLPSTTYIDLDHVIPVSPSFEPWLSMVLTSGMPDPAAAGAKRETNRAARQAQKVPKPTLKANLGRCPEICSWKIEA